MAKETRFFFLLFLFIIILFLHFHGSNEVELSQYEAVMRIKELLNIPVAQDELADLCTSQPTHTLSLSLSLSCYAYDENITQLHISGAGAGAGAGAAQHHLSTAASLFSNILNLPNLKVLSLVSLGLTSIAPLPPSLEILNLTSNFLHASIPRQISSLKSLQTLILDHNRLQGQIPTWIHSLPLLSVLSLNNNSINGPLPVSISNMTNLRTLVLSANNLSGDVVDLDKLVNLQILDLGSNNLGPMFSKIPSKLVTLVLRKNRFHCGVPKDFTSCYQLRKMDISLNEFTGPFPPSVLSIPSLAYLDIGGNKLSGMMMINLSCSPQLAFVNFSGNRLTGELPDCLKSRSVSYDGNCFSRVIRDRNRSSFCDSEALAVGISARNKGKESYDGAVVASSMVGGIVGVVGLAGMTFIFVKKKKPCSSKVLTTTVVVSKVASSAGYTLQLLKDARYISETMKMGALGFPTYRTYGMDQLREATDNFNQTNLMGHGSHGQVYKGWLTDGSVVAIRCLKTRRKHGIQTQLELIARLRHSHLVSALGHCIESDQQDSSVCQVFVVFEYVGNGTLRSLVSDVESGRQKLSWAQRIAAGIGVARGIQFLHTGIVPSVHSNHFKITDLLMDNHFHVKIKKYNLPLLTDNTISGQGGMQILHTQSKPTMLKCGEKQDIYDLGVILLEMIVGRTIITPDDTNISRDIVMVSLSADATARRSIVDPALEKQCSDDSVKTLIQLCVACLSKDPHKRPSVEDVIWNLQFAAQVQDNQDSPLHDNQIV